MRKSVRLTLFLLLIVGIAAGGWLAASHWLETDVARADPELVVTAREAAPLVESGKLRLVDIRRPSEWRQTGVASGAIPITMHQSTETFISRIRALAGKDQQVAIICATGGRTHRMQSVLAKAGIRVIDVTDGMMGARGQPGWIRAGLPLSKAP